MNERFSILPLLVGLLVSLLVHLLFVPAAMLVLAQRAQVAASSTARQEDIAKPDNAATQQAKPPGTAMQRLVEMFQKATPPPPPPPEMVRPPQPLPKSVRAQAPAERASGKKIPEPTNRPIRIGKDNGDDIVTVAWISYDDFQKLIAPRGSTEQPALQAIMDPVPGAPPRPDTEVPGGPAPTPTPGVIGARPTPRPATPRPAPLIAQVEKMGQKPFSPAVVAPVEKLPVPAPAAGARTSDVSSPTKIVQTPKPEDVPALGPAPTPTVAQAETKPRETATLDKTQPQSTPPRDIQPLEGQALAAATPKPMEGTTPGASPEAAASPATVAPAPPAASQPASVNEPQAFVPGGPGPTQGRFSSAPRSDRESWPVSLTGGKPLEVRPGGVLTGKGIEIKTAVPRLSTVARVSIIPNNPVVKLLFDKDGQVLNVTLVKSTGYENWDGPIIASLYRWRAGGKLLAELDRPFELEIHLILVDDTP